MKKKFSIPVIWDDGGRWDAEYQQYITLVNAEGIIPDVTVLDLTKLYERDVWGNAKLADAVIVIRPRTVEEMETVVGMVFGEGMWEGNADKLLMDRTVTIDQLPTTRQGLYERLLRLRMDPLIALQFVREIACGRGLSDEMRDELWMDFAPEWMAGYCEKIQYLLDEREVADLTRLHLCIAWAKRERMRDNGIIQGF